MPGRASARQGSGRNSSFSFFLPILPVPHPLPGRIKVAGWNGAAFVSDSVNGDDPPSFHVEPEYPSVELADMPQFEQSATKLTVILAIP